jgi:uncharacterized protein YdbL (DUF1318 family)
MAARHDRGRPSSCGRRLLSRCPATAAIAGGRGDNSFIGAMWVYTRNRGLWTQEGSKLVGTGAVGPALQGYSVALSGDGNTVIVGGYNDASGTGAAWVYTRNSQGLWTQQGSKLIGIGAVGPSLQGYSVALSGDGNTAIVGGIDDNSSIGAMWVYTRSSGVWKGSKLVCIGAVGPSEQGWSVALSDDGSTAIVGGPIDNDGYPRDGGGGSATIYRRFGDSPIRPAVIPGVIQAQTTLTSRSFFDHLAVIANLIVRCPTFEINERTLERYASPLGIHRAEIERRSGQFYTAILQSNEKMSISRDKACGNANSLYGPHGSAIPELLNSVP